MNKTEIKIFLTFFVIYSFFVQWNDVWDFNSSLSLTKAIVEKNRIEIDSYHNTTEVKSYYKGHYYSPVAPGLSFLMSWVYIICKEFTTFTSIHEFLLVIFSNPLYGALSSVLIYKILNFFIKDKIHKFFTTLVYGLGTSIFPYSLGFYVYIPTIFFILLVFFLLLREKSEYRKSFRNFFLAGIFAGFAGMTYPISFLVIFCILFYICIVDKKMLPFFILGGIIGFLPFIFYNYEILGFYTFFPAELIWHWSGKGGSWYPPPVNNLKILPRLLFYPWSGLFFYYPILFLSFLGVLLMFKKKKLECCIILIIFLIFISIWTFQSLNLRWWGDFSFGPRRLLLLVPFLVLGLPYTIQKFGLKIVIPFFLISLFNNLLGLQMWLSLENVLPPPIDKTYVERVENFQIFANPLKDIYFPNFLRNGPRSLLFENFIFNREINIKFGKNIEHLEKYRIELFSLPFVTIALKIPFLCLVPLAIVVFLIWSKDIFQANKVRKLLDRKIVSMIIILILIFFLTFIEMNVES
jgi:hypothetical protein